MLGSLLLSLALGWLANVDGTDGPCQAAQTTYVVGCCDDSKSCPASACKSCCAEKCASCCDQGCESCCDDGWLDGEVMCGGEPVEMGVEAKPTVVLQLRIVETSGRPTQKVAFLKPEELKNCLTCVQADPKAVVISSPTLVLCSGQTGQVSVGTPVPAQEAKCGGCCDFKSGSFSFTALPCVSADCRFVNLKMDGSVSGCPDHKEWAWKSEVVLPDGMSFVMDADNCCAGKLCSLAAQALTGMPHKNVTVFATVRIAGDHGQPAVQASTCTRDCSAHPTAPACCENCPSCDTVESNLARLERASELFKLAEQYERLNQFDVAAKILGNIQVLCPGSRIAGLAEDRCPALRMKELMTQSQNLRQLQQEWEKIWFIEMPHSLASDRVQGGIEESEAPATCSRLAQVLSSYRKACSEGNTDRARQLAIEALAIDPTCFAK
jgi:hypothetical protein